MRFYSNILRSLAVLSSRDRVKVIAIVVVQSLLSILDLVGIALVGLLGALTVTGIQSRPTTGLLSDLLSKFRLTELTFQNQAAVLGILAGTVLILKTALSIMFTKKTFIFLGNRSAMISASLMRKLLSRPVTSFNERTTQETIYALTHGVNNVTLGVIGNGVGVISDLFLVGVLFLGLFLVDAFVTISTFTFFSMIGFTLYLLLHNRALKLGESQAILNVENNEKISELVYGYREMFVRGRIDFFAKEISELRYRLSRFQADSSFLPYIGKYVIETALILGILVISATQFVLSNATDAVSTLSVFFAASTRIAPAILRVQQGSIQLRSALGSSLPTLELYSSLEGVPEIEDEFGTPSTFEHFGFYGEVLLKSVHYRYPSSEEDVLSEINLKVLPGEFLAIVGESGAGKSTLADLILGLVKPSHGDVTVSGVQPIEAIKKWPGAISYVAQETFLANASILENLILGFPKEQASLDLAWNALQLSKLDAFVRDLPKDINSNIGESGSLISGGQKQRIGIARALYTLPKLIIFDEATSSLDGLTEAKISKAIKSLKKKVTIIMIAHRLSTIKEADRIVYMEKGKILAVSSFKKLRREVPEFDKQARKMGL